MKKRKILGLLSFVMIILMAIFFVENKHDFSLGDFILTKIGFEIWSNGTSGLHYSGVVAALLSVLGIVGVVRFNKDVHENFGKFVLLFIIVSSFIYQPVYDSVYGFVKANMGGLSSIE